jgi:hypothetical protein
MQSDNYTGGLTVYCFGDPAKMSDEKVRLALRVHDEVSLVLIGTAEQAGTFCLTFDTVQWK